MLLLAFNFIMDFFALLHIHTHICIVATLLNIHHKIYRFTLPFTHIRMVYICPRWKFQGEIGYPLLWDALPRQKDTKQLLLRPMSLFSLVIGGCVSLLFPLNTKVNRLECVSAPYTPISIPNKTKLKCRYHQVCSSLHFQVYTQMNLEFWLFHDKTKKNCSQIFTSISAQ